LKWQGFILPAGLVLTAEACARIFGISSDSLAAPSQILKAAWMLLADGSLFVMTGQTLLSAVAGLLLGGCAGLVLAVVLGLSPTLTRLLRYPIEALRPIPSIAVLPIFLMVYGFGYRMEIAIIAFACFWPNLIIGARPRVRRPGDQDRAAGGAAAAVPGFPPGRRHFPHRLRDRGDRDESPGARL
jgi:NitT/TauT family transport system permease protein